MLALVYYVVIFYSLEFLYNMGWVEFRHAYTVPAGVSMYFWCATGSFVLTLLYCTVRSSKLVLAAFAIELILMTLNILCLMGADFALIVRRDLTDVLNTLAFLFLIGNWMNGILLRNNAFSPNAWSIATSFRRGYYKYLSILTKES